MGRENILIGKAGEDIAAEELRKNGYRIITRNYRTVFGEIDIVAKKDGSIVFAEVKTRLTHSLGPAYLSVTKKKAHHIVKNALCYLKRYGLIESPWRIDVVSIKLGENNRAEHIEIIESAIEGDDIW